VETEEQRRTIVQLGCDGAQGFLFAKPIESKRVPRLMDEMPTVPAAD
jgi:EAL domain-containing protein (putative c-di-GMP-specific phosphodiesterase class I)